MPIIQSRDSLGPYYRWGVHGHKYHYVAGNAASRSAARERAARQARAIKLRQSGGKGVVRNIIPLGPTDILGPAGYYSGNLAQARRAALNRIDVRGPRYAKLIQTLNAVATRLKNTQPQLSRNIRADISYLQRRYR